MDIAVTPPLYETLQRLIQRLPISIVLFTAVDGSYVPNARFAESYESGQLAGADLAGFAQAGADTWEAIELHRHDGSAVKVRAKSIAAPTGTLLVVDDASGPLSVEHYDYLQLRIAELESLSATDCLTGAWNRAHLERVIASETSRAARLN